CRHEQSGFHRPPSSPRASLSPQPIKENAVTVNPFPATMPDGRFREDRMSAALQSDDRIAGAWQQPVNLWQGAENSIHTDSVARRVGMRGGTIPGSVHLSHFVPILDGLFGDRWLTTGSISMYYPYATTDREDVRAIVKAPPANVDDVQLDA